MATEKDIRIRQRRDNLSNWKTSKGTLLKNEMAIAIDGDGKNREIRIGNANNSSYENSLVLYNPGETYVEFGGKALAGTLSPFGAVQDVATNFNVFKGKDAITAEIYYQNENTGEEWQPYDGINDTTIAAIFGSIPNNYSTSGRRGLFLGGSNKTPSLSDKLKIDILPSSSNYGLLTKLIIDCEKHSGLNMNIIGKQEYINDSKEQVDSEYDLGTYQLGNNLNEIPLISYPGRSETGGGIRYCGSIDTVKKITKISLIFSYKTLSSTSGIVYQIYGFAKWLWKHPLLSSSGKGYEADFQNKKLTVDNNIFYQIEGSDGILRTSNKIGIGTNQFSVSQYGNHAFTQGNTAKATGEDSSAMGSAVTASGSFSHVEGRCSIAYGPGSHAEGKGTYASGNYSHAEGIGTLNNDSSEVDKTKGAKGHYSHIEGQYTLATGTGAHAEGYKTAAEGWISHTEGYQTATKNEATHAEGYETIARGRATHTEGLRTKAEILGYKITAVSQASTGLYTLTITAENAIDYAVDDIISVKGNFEFNPLGKITAIDNNTITVDPTGYSTGTFELKDSITEKAIGDNSITITRQWDNVLWCEKKPINGECYYIANGIHTEGLYTYARRAGAHAEGYNNVSNGFYSHTEGYGNTAEYSAHAEGHDTKASGEMSHTEGYGTIAAGEKSHAEGEQTQSNGKYSHSEGAYNTIDSLSPAAHIEGIHNTITKAPYAHVEGRNNSASEDAAHAEGRENVASGENSHVEGISSQATGNASHAEGSSKATGNKAHSEGTNTIAQGLASHAEGGDNTRAIGAYSHSEGRTVIASGTASHAEGYRTTAVGAYAHAEGGNTYASGEGAHAEGVDNYAYGEGVHVQGKHAKRDETGKYAHIVGGGTWENKKNIHTLDWYGNAWFAGGITVGTKAEPLRQAIEVKISSTATEDVSESVYNDDTTILKFYQENASSLYRISFESRFPAAEYDINIKYNPSILVNNNQKESKKAFAKLNLYTGSVDSNIIYTEALPSFSGELGIVLEVYKK